MDGSTRTQMLNSQSPCFRVPVILACAVCGMDPDRSLASVYRGKTYSFCMREHKKLFDESPEQYIAKK